MPPVVKTYRQGGSLLDILKEGSPKLPPLPAGSLGRGPVKHRTRKKRKKQPPQKYQPIVTFRTTPELRLLIFEGAKLQRRSVTKFLEQLVVDWHSRQAGV